MSKHLQKDLDYLKGALLEVGALVEEAVQKALAAFKERRAELAQEVVSNDRKVDDAEVEIEEHCLKSLALHQPVAEDLRFITSVMKINNDLERMADCAVNIAKRALSLAKETPTQMPEGLTKMTQATLTMVRNSLDAFVNRDVAGAKQVCKQDDVVDQCHRNIVKELRQRMHSKPDEIDQALDIFSTARQIERIADLSTNIAEDVVYMVEGDIIRHTT